MSERMLGAFPTELAAAVLAAREGLGPASRPATVADIQDTYDRRWGQVVVAGQPLSIPYRQYQDQVAPVADPQAESVRQAWLTRHASGWVRESALRALLAHPEPWHVPYVVQLCGEYVLPIGARVERFAATLDQQPATILDSYRQFWATNPEFIELTRARAASYWAANHSWSHQLSEFPAHRALQLITRAVR